MKNIHYNQAFSGRLRNNIPVAHSILRRLSSNCDSEKSSTSVKETRFLHDVTTGLIRLVHSLRYHASFVEIG